MVFLGFLLGCLLFQLAFKPYFHPFFSADYWRTIGKIGEALRIVHVSYVDEGKADLDELSNEALAGTLQSLDRYSNYLPAEAYEAYRKSSRMEFEGIGVEVQTLADRVVVVRVFEGGSAKEEGMLPGDSFLSVDGEDVTGLSLADTVQRIKGAPETRVAVRIRRLWPEAQEKVFDVTRRFVKMPSVTNVQLLVEKVGYLKVSRFTEDTHALLQKALDELTEKGAKSLILDLRGNPGGLLTASITLASEFLADDKMVVSVRGRKTESEEKMHALADDRNWGKPVVVLMDGNSASASEILAGALKAHGLATVVGEQSVGKGTVQTVYNLRDAAGMVLTTAKYYLPDGTTIAGTGVEPDLVVEMPEETYSQVRLSLLHRGSFSAGRFEKTFGFAPVKDPQLDAAVDVLLKKEASLTKAGGPD